MNFRLLISAILILFLAACSTHNVPNRDEVARLITRQLNVTNAIDENQPMAAQLYGDSVSNLNCQGNGVIATCQYEIYGHHYQQIFGYSKYGWTGRSSVHYVAR